MKYLIVLLFGIFSMTIYGQENKSRILEKTKTTELQAYASKLSNEYAVNHRDAILLAIRNGMDTVGIDKIDENGVLRYEYPTNTVAANSTNTDELRLGGSLGLDLRGDGMTAGIWEATETSTSGNIPLTTHFNLGNGTTSVVTIQDGSTTASSHATHVAGTMVGDGTHDANAIGMAPLAELDAYSSGNDEAEMATAAAAGLLISNHSYGRGSGWQWLNSISCWEWKGGFASYTSTGEDADFGRYDEQCRIRDSIAFNAPQYLIFQSSGNDRDDNPTNGISNVRLDGAASCTTYNTATHPPGDAIGWDNIPSNGIAKNIMTVGAIDAASGNALSPFSSVGPTDDGRIKPDIVGHGVLVYSSTATSNTTYATFNGTSMATPNVSGSAILLQEYHEDLFGSGSFMNGSTLKGLIIHTAADLGNAGPDYSFGWGLMDAEAAATVLADAHAENRSYIYEDTHTGVVKNYGLLSACPEDVTVTMAYTDLPGDIQTGLDVSTPNLVNDLDIRLNDGTTTQFPWVMNPAAPQNLATTGDNDVDNVEQIQSAGDANLQILQILNEGVLSGGSQNYSLVMTGVDEVCEVIAFSQGSAIINTDASYCSTLAYSTSATITTSTEVSYTNSDRIVLSPGFSAAAGSKVRAYITPPCN